MANIGLGDMSDDTISVVLEVLPPGPDARKTALALLEASAGDANAAVNRYFTTGTVVSTPAGPQTITPTKLKPDLSSTLKPNLCDSAISTSRGKRPMQDESVLASVASRPAKQGRIGPTGPLAERVRPDNLKGLVGQSSFRTDSALGKLLREDKLPSILLWGPPGCGKTTVAGIVACATKKRFVKLSATQAGVKEVRKIVDEALGRQKFGQATILFLDEIHRWNKTQQDALLPHVESGLITLIGATTENPSFSLNSALLSRCQVSSSIFHWLFPSVGQPI